MREQLTDRQILERCLAGWEEHGTYPPLRPRSVKGTGCLRPLVTSLLLIGALVLAASGYLEEDRDHGTAAMHDVKGVQGCQLQRGREGQDIGHGAHRAAGKAGRA